MTEQTYWITKWWETRGIFTEKCTLSYDEKYASNREKRIFLAIGRDAFETEEEAKQRVLTLVLNRKKSLQKRLAKLERLKKELNKPESTL